MTDRQEVLSQLISVMSGIFNLEDVSVGEQTNAYDVDGWDSLSHARFVLSVEQHFKIRFPGDLLFDKENIGDMLDAITTLLQKKND